MYIFTWSPSTVSEFAPQCLPVTEIARRITKKPRYPSLWWGMLLILLFQVYFFLGCKLYVNTYIPCLELNFTPNLNLIWWIKHIKFKYVITVNSREKNEFEPVKGLSFHFKRSTCLVEWPNTLMCLLLLLFVYDVELGFLFTRIDYYWYFS